MSMNNAVFKNTTEQTKMFLWKLSDINQVVRISVYDVFHIFSDV